MSILIINYCQIPTLTAMAPDINVVQGMLCHDCVRIWEILAATNISTTFLFGIQYLVKSLSLTTQLSFSNLIPTGFVERRFRSNPRVFIRISTFVSVSNLNSWSVPSVNKMLLLIFCSAWKAMFIKPQMPLSLSAELGLEVSLHSSSIAPASTMGYNRRRWN